MIKVLTALAGVLTAVVAAAQGPTPADGWFGQLQRVLSARGAGYQDEQTQTWTITGAAITRGGFRDYPATWTVTGSGSRTSAAGTDTWTRSGSDSNSSLTFFVPVNTTTIRVAPGQRAASAAGGLRGTAGGARIVLSADEWRFQYFDTQDAAAQPQMSGSRTQTPNGRAGWRQPPGVTVTETCTWNFSKGSVGTAPPSSVATTSTAASLAPGGGPRTIALPSFTAEGFGAGSFTVVPRRTIPLGAFAAAGFGAGSFVVVPPRTIALPGFTAAGVP